MSPKREKIAKSLKKFMPEAFIPYVIDLIFQEPLVFRISKPRKTKAGDYRPPYNNQPHRISVNANLNPYAFLITTIHEFAHMTTFIKYGPKVMPHGQEWKNEFKRLLIPVLEKKELPKEIEIALLRSLNNLSASSCTDLHLSRALKRFDKKSESLYLLEEIGNDAHFRIEEKVFQRGILRRTRYLCKEVDSGKEYLINRLAEVELLEKQYE